MSIDIVGIFCEGHTLACNVCNVSRFVCRFNKNGVPIGLHVCNGCNGTKQSNLSAKRDDLSPRLEPVQVIAPLLHQHFTFGQELRAVVSRPQSIRNAMR